MLGRKGKTIHRRMCEYACECATDAYWHIRTFAYWHIGIFECANMPMCEYASNLTDVFTVVYTYAVAAALVAHLIQQQKQ